HAAEHAARVREEVDLAQRASQTLRQEMFLHHITWAKTWRSIERLEPSTTPGASRDAARLLGYAEAASRAERREAYQLVRQTAQGERRVRGAVRAHVRHTMEAARQGALAQASDEARADELVDARAAEPGDLDEDLKVTDAALTRSLEGAKRYETAFDFHRLKGTLVPPVSEKPAHSFGKRQRSRLSDTRHTGYTYFVERGTQVRAVAPGMVVFSRNMDGFGLVLLIDHGAGYHSVYAHMSAVDHDTGHMVQRGQRLGASGASGSLEGPKLYFELRKDGVPINPSSWFVRP
ncbi:MAG: peptidoglycan DD-metalloendopeptidase family protein, partial [Myxococcota bacterium]